jgi:hypothetical protein
MVAVIPGAAVARQAPESPVSAVCWPAIFAGALTISATALVLLALGAGLGLAVMPWCAGASTTAFAVSTAIWWVVLQWLSSAAGGYLTGRLRTRWAGTHTHEVFFRDTAHGFVSWALAAVFGALLVALATSTLLGAEAQAMGAPGASRAAAAPDLSAGTAQYEVDTLFRGAAAASPGPDPRVETLRLLAHDLPSGEVRAEDRDFIARLVAARTAVPPDDARQKVDAAIGRTLQAVDAVRKAAAAAAIFTALAMLIGAFIAATAAALGGHLRDEHP